MRNISDKIQPVNEYENSTVVFDEMLPSKQENIIDLFFTKGRHNSIDIYFISQNYCHLPENTFRNVSNIIISFKQTLRDIILLFHDQNKVRAVRLQEKLGKQNFHQGLKKVFKPVTKTIKDISDDVKKTMMLTSKENSEALANLINKLLEKTIGRGIIATYLTSNLSENTNPENTTQFKLVKNSNSNRVIDLLIHNTIPFNLYDNLLTIRDKGKVFELKGDPLKMITN